MPLAFVPFYVWLPALLLVLVLPVFILFLAPRLGGWMDWARRFPAGAIPPEGTVYPGCGSRILGKRNSRYGGMLAVTVSGAGLHVAPTAILKPTHPPILLPWTCVRTVGEAPFMGRDKLKVTCEADGNVFELYLPPDAVGTVSSQRPAA